MLHVDQMYLTANGVLVRFKNRCVCALNTENAEKTSYCASERYFPLRSIGSKCGWFRLVGSSVVLLSQTAQHKIKRNKRKRCIEHFQNWNTCGLFFRFLVQFLSIDIHFKYTVYPCIVSLDSSERKKNPFFLLFFIFSR